LRVSHLRTVGLFHTFASAVELTEQRKQIAELRLLLEHVETGKA
jgi:hypothetical protein